MIDLSKEKLHLDYPCNWIYKLICHKKSNINIILKEVLIHREHNISNSKVSTKGNYKSYTLELLVHSEDDRKELYKLLREHKYIKIVV